MSSEPSSVSGNRDRSNDAAEGHVYKLRLNRLNMPEDPKYIELHGFNVPLGITQSNSSSNLDSDDRPAEPLMEITQKFLNGSNQVLLLMGDPGTGKTTFLKQLERALWNRYTGPNDPIPIYIDLATYHNTLYGLLDRILISEGFNVHQIIDLRNKQRAFVLICDGYDQAQIRYNIYNLNKFNGPLEWKVKLIIGCRKDNIGCGSDGQFEPSTGDRYDLSEKPSIFEKASTAPFTHRQIAKYVEKFVDIPLAPEYRRKFNTDQHITNLVDNIPFWDVSQYMEALTDIPNLMELAKNPYLLSFILELLPAIAGPQRDVTRISFDELYTYIFEAWMTNSMKILSSRSKSLDEERELSNMMEFGFDKISMRYLKNLALAIFKNQKDTPVVSYSHLTDQKENPWKTPFFGPDSKLIRESVPLIRSGVEYRFIHRSLHYYLYSLAVFDPHISDEGGSNFEGSHSDNISIDIPGTHRRAFAQSYINMQSKMDQTVEIDQTSDKGLSLQADHPLGVMSISSLSMIIQFLADRVQKSSLFKEQLIETVRNSRTKDSDDQTLAANAMTILVRSGMTFNGADLSGIKIKGANLTGGKFYSADFCNSDLRDVIFDRDWSDHARFEGAKMSGIQFGKYLVGLEYDYTPVNFALSSCKKFYAIGFDEGTIIIYNTATWTPYCQLKDLPVNITSLAFSPMDNLLLFGNASGDVRVYDYTINKSTTSQLTNSHYDCVSSVAFSKDGQYFATAGYDSTIKIWKTSSLETVNEFYCHDGRISSISFNPGGNQIISGGSDSTIRLWDVNTGELVHTFSCDKGAISNVQFEPNGSYFASLRTNSDAVQIWSTETRELKMELRGKTRDVTRMDISSDGKFVISSCKSGSIQIWDAQSGHQKSLYKPPAEYVENVLFSHDKNEFITYNTDRSIQVWRCQPDTNEYRALNRRRLHENFPYLSTTQQTRDDDQMMSLLPIWMPSAVEQSPVEYSPQFFSASNEIGMIIFSPNGHYIATLSRDGVIQVWNISTGDILWTEHYSGDISSIAYSPNSHQIVYGDMNGNIMLVDALSGTIIHTFSADDGAEITCIAFSPCGKKLAIGDEFGTIILWSISNETVELISIMDCHSDIVTYISFSSDSTHIVSACNGEVKLWNIHLRKILHNLPTENQSVNRVVFLSSGQFIASGTSDGAVTIWTVKTGTRYSIFQDEDGVYDPVFSSDGLRIWTRSSDFRIRTWIDTAYA
ncbi:hypothetical protein FBU30_001965 [Linnemannia zychae]|nr:hypothetical protein FBU30_001965 [Linnemannia zychae]